MDESGMPENDESPGGDGSAALDSVGMRVRQERERAGLSQAKLARMVGTSQQAIADLETRKDAGSKHLIAIAGALGVAPEYLYLGSLRDRKMPPPQERPRVARSADPAPIIGTVAVGVWREAQIQPFPTDEADGTIPCLPTRVHEGRRQYGLRVEGESMNRVVRSGEYVAVVLTGDGALPAASNVVLVERRRGGMYEYTLKRLLRPGEEGFVLKAESDDPRYTTMIVGHDGIAQDGVAVKIIGVAVGKYAPL